MPLPEVGRIDVSVFAVSTGSRSNWSNPFAVHGGAAVDVDGPVDQAAYAARELDSAGSVYLREPADVARWLTEVPAARAARWALFRANARQPAAAAAT